jgi:hypothetical protein
MCFGKRLELEKWYFRSSPFFLLLFGQTYLSASFQVEQKKKGDV